MGVYDNLAVSQTNTTNNNLTLNPNNYQMFPAFTTDEKPKCKCPNPKHTNGCSIEPESEYCVFCARGCVKRVQAIHVRYT